MARRFRHLPLIVMLACSHGPATPPRASGPVAPRAATAPDPLEWIPGDSDIVVRVDLAELRKSPLWTKYAGVVRDLFTPGFGRCGYDPLADIATFTAGIPMAPGREGVFVARGADRTKTLQCLHDSTTDTATTATFDGDVVTLTNKSGKVNMLTFVDATTFVMIGSTAPTKEKLAATLRLGAPLRHDAAYLAVESKLHHRSVLTFAARPSAKPFFQRIADKLGKPVVGFYAWFDVTERVECQIGLDFETDRDATAVIEEIAPQTERAQAFVDRWETHAAGATVTVDIAITEAQITRLVELIEPLVRGN